MLYRITIELETNDPQALESVAALLDSTLSYMVDNVAVNIEGIENHCDECLR